MAVLGGCKKEQPPEGVAGPPTVYAEEKCLDEWLAAKKLDAYGSPEGTMYAGGTPLFDEQTGKTRDRLKFVYEKHPEAKASCEPAAKPK